MSLDHSSLGSYFCKVGGSQKGVKMREMEGFKIFGAKEMSFIFTSVRLGMNREYETVVVLMATFGLEAVGVRMDQRNKL